MKTTSLHNCIKRQKYNIRAIGSFDLLANSRNADVKWIFDNKIKLLYLCSENIKTLRRVGKLPAVKGDVGILGFCRYVTLKHAYSLDEDTLAEEIETAQKGGGFFTVKELQCLKPMLLSFAFDAVGDEINGKTEHISPLAVRMIYELENIDFTAVYKAVSRTEEVLLRDPSGVYERCDGATKAMYRMKISRTAERLKISEFDLAKQYLKTAENSEGKRRHIGYHILKGASHIRMREYFFLADFVPMLIMLSITALAYKSGSVPLFLAAIFAYLPVRRLTKLVTDDIVARVLPADLPPRLDLKYVPDNAKTLVTYTVSFSKKTNNAHLFDKLLLYARVYNDENLSFCVLADLPDSDTETDAHDAEILEYAEKRLTDIRKYNSRCSLFYRKRTYSASERKYIGNERKRGAQEELAAFISGEQTSLVCLGNSDLDGIRYILALDADTEIAYNDILKLLATALHPCNAPEFAVKGSAETVTDGYGVFVPTAAVSLKNMSDKNRYTILKNAFEGRGSYENAVFSSYTALSEEGVYCGKGLIDVEAYMRVIAGKFPRERILSHDIAEGAFLRAAAVSDAFVYDSPPATLLSERKRLHRWIRGDFQSLVLTRRYITDADGVKYKNPLGKTQKRLISSPVKDHLTETVRLTSLVFSLSAGGGVGFFVYLLSVSDRIYECVKRFASAIRIPKRTFPTGAPDYRRAVLFASVWPVMSGADLAWLSADALFRAYYRSNISHRRLLEWTVSSAADAQKDGKNVYAKSLKASVVLGVLSVIAAALTHSLTSLLLFLYGISWVIYPFAAQKLNTSFIDRPEKTHTDSIRADASRMWAFFSENVTEKYNFLPPDNVSYFPERKTAARTSPTNIGLYLMSVLNAFDFGFIGSDELWKRLTDTLRSVTSLERFRGHLYNWYDIETKRVLTPLYVSTVDSGNLAVSLLTVKNGIKGLGALFTEPIRLIDALLSEMDFAFLYSKKRNLFYIGYDTVRGAYDLNFYDLYPSEMLTVSFYASAKKQIPYSHFSSLGRIFSDRDSLPVMLSWSGTAFEYFMPSLWLPSGMMTERGEMLAAAAEKQRRSSAKFEGADIYGMSESAYYDFDEEMNYSYKANGVPSLSISHDSYSDSVFSPYSLYLMLGHDKNAPKTLTELKNTSLYGRYGFYDALDLTPRRVGAEGAVIKQYMSHHIGMSIAGAANYCLDGANVKRFTDDPDVAAALHLLYVKNEICRPVSDDELHKSSFEVPVLSENTGEITRQGTAVLSNGLIRISADESGNAVLRSGSVLLTRQRDGALDGLGVLIRADGVIYNCLCGRESGVKHGFFFDGAKISYENEIIHGDGVIRTETVFAVDPETPSAALRLNVTGSAKSVEALVYTFPVLNRERDYKSAPAYSDLFLTVKADADTVTFKRRKRDGGDDAMHLSFSPEPEKLITDITGHAAFPLTDGFAAHLFDSDGDNFCGAAVHPFVCAVFPLRTGDCAFEMRISHGEERYPTADFNDILFGAEKRFRLFSSYSGADKNAVGAAMRIYSMINDTDRKITECGTPPRYKRDILWRFGISGDLPVVICCTEDMKNSSSLYAAEEILKAKRFLFISGVRFDLVIIADDTGYMNGDVRAVLSLTEKTGCARLRSKNNGVFVIGKSSLSDNDVTVMCSVASGVIGVPDADVSYPLKSAKNVSVPAVVEGERAFESVGDGVKITDGALPVPWCAVYANSAFGTLLTNKTAGFSWFRNSSLGTVSHRHTDILAGTAGERLTLETENGVFDLLLSSESVCFNSDSALYVGRADGIPYEIRIGTDAKLPVKLYHVSLGEEASGKKLTLELSLYPDSPCAFSEGVLTLLKEMSAKVVLFSVSDHPTDDAEVSADRICVASEFTGEDTGFVIAAYPPSASASVTEYAKYKYSSADAILAGLCEYGENLRDKIMYAQYTGGERYLSDMLGASLLQAYLYRIVARTGYYQSGGAYGYRDQLQDSLAALYFSPQITKMQILRSCRHQYTDGRAQHWWHTGAGGLRSRCSDDYMWLPYVTAEYVLSTSDFDILMCEIPYLTSPPLKDGEEDRYESPSHSKERFGVLDHCLRAVKASFETGSHGLPLMLSGDWNDGMNGVGARGRGESVWLAFFFAAVYARFAQMLRLYSEEYCGIAEKLERKSSELLDSAERAWDGKWYRRAYDDSGNPLGASSADECKIDILPQAFSVFAGADRERSVIAMESLYTHLYDGEHGILRLFAPSFKNHAEYGYITRYPEGIRENGGQYTHAAVWAARAFFELGAYKRGKEILRSVSPSVIYENGRMKGRYTAEPYLICADVYFGEGITGKSGWSGYTGSAAWYYTTAMKYLFGVEFSLGELTLTPRPEYVTGDFTLRFMYNGNSVTVCGAYTDSIPDESFDLCFDAIPEKTLKAGEITKDIKILLKIRN